MREPYVLIYCALCSTPMRVPITTDPYPWACADCREDEDEEVSHEARG